MIPLSFACDSKDVTFPAATPGRCQSNDWRRTAQEGGILEALRRSPLVDADIAIARRFESGRNVDL